VIATRPSDVGGFGEPVPFGCPGRPGPPPEAGSVELLWVCATNPAESLPDLARIRRILAKSDLFVVVRDLYLTETAALADVVPPAAT
jgi:anaerobic selenocysteine-containing dehydrogenase